MPRRRARFVLFSALLLAAGLLLFARCASLPAIPPEKKDAELAAAGYRTGTVIAAGRSVRWVAAGAGPGPALLCIHGSPGDWRAWEALMDDAELRAGGPVLAYDRPGFGATGGPAVADLSQQAAVAAAVLAAAVPGTRALVAGHSLGGPIAARLAVDRPELVAGLLLIAPSIDPALERHRWYNVAGSLRPVQWFLPAEWIASNREIWPLRGELEALAPALAGVSAPTTVIQGTDDDLVDPANAEFVARSMPAAAVRVVEVPKEGHFVLWTRGDLVRAEIEALRERSAGREDSAP